MHFEIGLINVNNVNKRLSNRKIVIKFNVQTDGTDLFSSLDDSPRANSNYLQSVI